MSAYQGLWNKGHPSDNKLGAADVSKLLRESGLPDAALGIIWKKVKDYSVVGKAEMDFTDFNNACSIAERWKAAQPASDSISATAGANELKKTGLEVGDLRTIYTEVTKSASSKSPAGKLDLADFGSCWMKAKKKLNADAAAAATAAAAAAAAAAAPPPPVPAAPAAATNPFGAPPPSPTIAASNPFGAPPASPGPGATTMRSSSDTGPNPFGTSPAASPSPTAAAPNNPFASAPAAAAAPARNPFAAPQAASKNPFGAAAAAPVAAAPAGKVRAVKVMLMNIGQLGLAFRDAATAQAGVGLVSVNQGAAGGAHGITMADTIVSVNKINTRGFHRKEFEGLLIRISKRGGLQAGLEFLLEPADGPIGLPFRSHDVASTQKWFWMPTSKEEVNEVVKTLPPCGFIVRDAESGSDGKMAFVCVINDQGVGLMNVKILEDVSGKYHVKGGTLFPSLDKVVESLGPLGQRAMISKATKKPFRVVDMHATSIVQQPIRQLPMTLQELAQDDFAFQADASAAAAAGRGGPAAAAAAAAAAPVVQRRPQPNAAPRRASSAERNRDSFFPSGEGGGGGGDDSGSDYDESTMDPAGIGMASINESSAAAAAAAAAGGGGGGGGGFQGKSATLPAGATLSPPPMQLQRSNSSGGSRPSIFDAGAVPAGLAAGTGATKRASAKKSGGAAASAAAERIGLNQKTVNVMSTALETHTKQEFYMPTADSAKYVAAGFLIKNSGGTDVFEMEGRNKFSAKKPMVLKFSTQMYGVYVTPDVDKLETAHVSYKKKEGVFEIHGYKPCYSGQAVADKKDGRYAWAKMYVESTTKIGIGIAAEEGSKKGTHEFHEMYTAEQNASGDWTMERVDEDDDSHYPVATFTTTTKDFYTGQPVEVTHVSTVADEDCALALVVATLLNDISMIS